MNALVESSDTLGITGRIVPGQGLASGRTLAPNLATGTIEASRAFFAAAGLPIEGFFNGTINIDIAPRRWRPRRSIKTLAAVKWHPSWEPETFSFFECRLHLGHQIQAGLIYHPHPETKPTQFHGRHVLEVWTGFIEGLRLGDEVRVELDQRQVTIENSGG